LHSADGVADEIERNYTYYLYVMASASRGKYREFQRNALEHGGDTVNGAGNTGREPGLSLHGCSHGSLGTARPHVDMYTAMIESSRSPQNNSGAARGSSSPRLSPSTAGRVALGYAAEMRDLYLLRKPWTAMSAKFPITLASSRIPADGTGTVEENGPTLAGSRRTRWRAVRTGYPHPLQGR